MSTDQALALLPFAATGAAWFVYYRVPASQQVAAVQVVHGQQQRLRNAYPGLQTRLMQRLDPQPALSTLMEIYAMSGAPGQAQAAVPCDAIEAAMATALAGLLQGERHGEVFEACA